MFTSLVDTLALLPVLAATEVSPELKKACGDTPGLACESIYDWTGSERVASIGDWIIAKPLTIFVIVLVAAIVGRIVRRVISRSMRRLMVPTAGGSTGMVSRRTSSVLLSSGDSTLRTDARVETLTAVFRSMATGLIWFIATLWILETVGVSLGPLLATAGVLGVALGFGTQTMVRDFIAGFFLVVEDQFGVGDVIDVGGGAKGTVERVTLRATHLRDVEGNVWHVANGQITKVANKSQEWARALIDVVLPYDVDIDAVSAVMQRVADTLASDPHWSTEILERPEIWGIQEFTAAGVEVRLVIKTRPASQFGVLRELRARLKAEFDRSEIAFAYASGPTDVVLVDKRSAGPVQAETGATNDAPTSTTGPRSGLGGFGGESDDNGGLGGDSDAD
jgi:small-conductance mechanosensitive channel